MNDEQKAALLSVSWQGYKRADNRKGIRNKLLVIYTVECASYVAKQIAAGSQYPDTDVIGFSGCTDNDYAIRMLVAMVRHPNVGAVLAVGLGCEYVQPSRLAKAAEEAGKPSAWMMIQEEGGTSASIRNGIRETGRLGEALKQTPRCPMGFADLIVGAECGGSDFTSGLAGNPLVGSFFDRLVDLGGTAIFEEIVEAVGLRDLLISRAADSEAVKQLGETYDKAMDYCRQVRQYSISPGNFVGGLSSIEEKSMGAVIKSGSRPIQGVIRVSEQPSKPGLWLLDSTPDPHWMQFGITNPNDNEGLMDLICSGAQLLFLVTGRGNVVGSAVSPVIKITGNHETYERMKEDMDIDASEVLFAAGRMEPLTDRLCGYIVDICGGSLTCAEKLGHREYFIPYKYQNHTGRKCEEQ